VLSGRGSGSTTGLYWESAPIGGTLPGSWMTSGFTRWEYR
jgi:hypothetical protein